MFNGIISMNCIYFYYSRIVFWMVFGILLGTGLFYLIFADGQVQPWNDPNKSIQKIESNRLNEVEMSQEMKETFIKNF